MAKGRIVIDENTMIDTEMEESKGYEELIGLYEFIRKTAEKKKSIPPHLEILINRVAVSLGEKRLYE